MNLNSKILLKIDNENIEDITIGCSWENNKETDIDIILIFLNSESELTQNKIIDVIYYEKTESLDGSCKHFGDDTSGFDKKHKNDNEVVYLNLKNLDIKIDTIAVVLNEYNGLNLNKIENLKCKIYSGKPEKIDELFHSFDINNHKDFDSTTTIIGYFDKNKEEMEWSFESKNKEMLSHQINSIKKSFENIEIENTHKDSILNKIKNLFIL
jgi:tellurium resistance protein TerZ